MTLNRKQPTPYTSLPPINVLNDLAKYYSKQNTNEGTKMNQPKQLNICSVDHDGIAINITVDPSSGVGSITFAMDGNSEATVLPLDVASNLYMKLNMLQQKTTEPLEKKSTPEEPAWMKCRGCGQEIHPQSRLHFWIKDNPYCWEHERHTIVLCAKCNQIMEQHADSNKFPPLFKKTNIVK